MKALQHMGKRALPALREMLQTASNTERCRAARAMGRLGPEASREAVPDLLGALGDSTPGVRGEAMMALVRIGITNDDLAPRLIGELSNDITGAFAATLLNSIERNRAQEKLPPSREAGYTYGMACLGQGAPALRLNGAIQLASVAQEDPRAKAALASLLHDENGWVREGVAKLMTNRNALANFKLVSD